jgi:hypothetical protein
MVRQQRTLGAEIAAAVASESGNCWSGLPGLSPLNEGMACRILLGRPNGGGMAQYLCQGYICECGERITVLRLPVEQQMSNPPSQIVVLCRKGHERKIRMDQIGQLDHWIESDILPAN